MFKSWLPMLTGIALVFGVADADLIGTVHAQSLSSLPPTDLQQVGPWREAWYTYGRDIRTWCATHELKTLAPCLEREMAKAGVSTAWFAALYKTAPTPTYTPPRRGLGMTITTTCHWKTSAWESTMICTTE